ncbi:hypothetical protein EDB19DRAFT_1901473 [Suillus lakei]|nr:hypothetical protein EDB19DRAFT_1901473 [Suillus lakei]
MPVPDAHIIQFDLNSISSYDLLDHNGDPTYDFLSTPPYQSPLVPLDFQWHQVESVSACIPSPPASVSSSYASTSSTSAKNPAKLGSELPFPSSFPSSAALASMPIPCSRGYSRSKDPDHKIGTNIERDNRHITRIIAHCWNRLSESEKQVWRNKAATEKAIHAMKGTARKTRNAASKSRKLLLAGKHGEELEVAVKEIDNTMKVTTSTASPESSSGSVSKGLHPCEGDFDGWEIQPFRSPLLPPTKSTSPPIYDFTGATQISPPLTTIEAIPKSCEYSEQPYQALYDTNESTSSTSSAYPLLLTQPDFYPLYQSARLSPLPVALCSEPATLFINYAEKNGGDNISVMTPSPPDFSAFSWDTFSTTCYGANTSHSYATFPSY